MPDRTCLIACVKDEGPDLLEWVAHHIAIGFDDIVIASNDCSDGSDAMLDRLAELSLVTHIPNPPPYKVHNNIQHTGFLRMQALPQVRTATWLIPIDADEFLNIHVGKGHVTDLLDHSGHQADAILINWRWFGDGGAKGLPSGRTTRLLTRAATAEQTAATPYIGQVKHLFRNHARYDFLSAHGGGVLQRQTITWRHGQRYVTPSGRAVDPTVYDGSPVPHRPPFEFPDWSVAQINHYGVKTWAHMMLRDQRGDVLKKPKYRRRYFDRYNLNEAEDQTISRTAPARTKVLNQLKADPVLGPLHQASIEHVREALAAIRKRTAS